MIELYPKKIDLYIIRKFMTTFFLAILFMIVIVIIFDISEKIDNFVSKQAPLKAVVFDYYLNFIPYFMNMFSSLFVFLTVIFFTSKMAQNSEIVAILSGGISFHRLMVPYMFSAGVICALSLFLNLWVIPKANVERLAFENQYVKTRSALASHDVHYQIGPNTFVYVESFSPWNNTAYNFSLEEIKDNRLVKKVEAESAVWDSTLCGWTMKNYFIREFEGEVEDKVKCGERKDTVIALTIDDFYRNKLTVQRLQEDQLNELIKTQEMRGDSNIIYAQIEKHTRWSMPFSAFILTIIGVSLSSKKKRGGIGWNLAIGIGLSFSYILFQRFSQMFVITGSMPPGLAIWIPNMMYAVVAAVLYRIAPK